MIRLIMSVSVDERKKGPHTIGNAQCIVPRDITKDHGYDLWVKNTKGDCSVCKGDIDPGEVYILAVPSEGSGQKRHCQNCFVTMKIHYLYCDVYNMVVVADGKTVWASPDFKSRLLRETKTR